MEKAYEHGADIISLSLGSGGRSQAAQDLITFLSKKGIVICAAAGNTGKETNHYPAHYDNVIAVAAMDHKGNRAPFSTMNGKNDVICPGKVVPSTAMGGGYLLVTGTSPATPHASATAALAKSIDSKFNHSKYMDGLKNTCDPPHDRRKEYGFGKLRADKIVK